MSFEALRSQGFSEDHYMDFVSQYHEKLRFSTGGGQRNSRALGFQDVHGQFGDANHFVLDYPAHVFVLLVSMWRKGALFGFQVNFFFMPRIAQGLASGVTTIT